MIEQLANALHVPEATLQAALISSLVIGVIGFILIKIWKVLLIGAIAFLTLIAYVKGGVTPVNPDLAKVAPVVASSTETANSVIEGFSKEESDFVKDCLAQGENGKSECIGLWYEKQYVEKPDTKPDATDSQNSN